MDILGRIKDIRESRNMSVYELAKKSGIAKNTIYRWYSMNYTPTLDTLKILCEKGFEMSLSEFFAVDGQIITLTPEIKEIVDLWTKLTSNQKQAVKQMILSYQQ